MPIIPDQWPDQVVSLDGNRHFRDESHNGSVGPMPVKHRLEKRPAGGAVLDNLIRRLLLAWLAAISGSLFHLTFQHLGGTHGLNHFIAIQLAQGFG